MIYICDLTLWLLVAFHFVGGATLFRRYFPDESPWLGYILPALVMVMVLNFIEHIFPIPSLLWLLPITMGGLIWSVFTPGYSWNGLRLPTAVFLLAFAFNFSVKCLHPDIPTNDALADLNRILDFCLGNRLPPTDSWLPPFDHRWYYTYQHYAASVVKRLFGIEVGTAYNMSFILVNALTCYAAAGVAYLVSGRRAWVALLVMPVLESGLTGSTPWLIMTMKNPDFGYALDIDAGWRNHDPNPIFRLFDHEIHQALVLEVPGEWLWYDQYHSNLSGFLLTFLSALVSYEVLDKRRSNWPWILLLIMVPLTMVASAWVLILTTVICGGAFVLALAFGRRPDNPRFVVAAVLVSLALFWPQLMPLSTWLEPENLAWCPPDWRTPFWIFVVQWWPIYLPWFLLCFVWHRMSLALRWLHFCVAFLYILLEIVNVGTGWRWDTIEHMWGAIFGLGLVTLLAMLMVHRNFVFRIATIFIVFCALLTFKVRVDDSRGWVDWNRGFMHLEGNAFLRNDPQKGRMFQVLSQLRKGTVLAGKCDWNYTPPPCLAVFSENRCYVAWFNSEQRAGHRGEAEYRTALNNQFYAGQMADPLGFLRENLIDAVIIWPDDGIPDDVLAKLQQQLAPIYEYVDCTMDGPKKAGIFLLRPMVHPAND